MIEVRSLSIWQRGLTTKWNEGACTGCANYVNISRKRVSSEPKGCITVEPLKTFRGHEEDEIARSQIKDVGKQRL